MPYVSPCPATGYTVNNFYEYTAAMEGSFSGGTLPAGTVIPHPAYPTQGTGSTNCIAIQLNAVTLGGFNGLNN